MCSQEREPYKIPTRHPERKRTFGEESVSEPRRKLGAKRLRDLRWIRCTFLDIMLHLYRNGYCKSIVHTATRSRSQSSRFQKARQLCLRSRMTRGVRFTLNSSPINQNLKFSTSFSYISKKQSKRFSRFKLNLFTFIFYVYMTTRNPSAESLLIA